jgi:hypothetical protein
MIKQQILEELQNARSAFHNMLASLPAEAFYKQSLNPGWTNGEILAHTTFGFIIVNVLLPMARAWGRLLNAFTGPFNWINALGARGQGKVFTRQRVGKIYDWAYFSLLRKINSIREDEWEHGMYYPTKWDSNFNDFMTLEKLFYYPVIHLNFHLAQIAREKDVQ